jgi:hypothetical protein
VLVYEPKKATSTIFQESIETLVYAGLLQDPVPKELRYLLREKGIR